MQSAKSIKINDRKKHKTKRIKKKQAAVCRSPQRAFVWLVNWLGGWCNSPPHLFGPLWWAPAFPSIRLRMQPIYHNWYQNKLKCGVSCLHSAAYQKREVGRPWQVWGLCVIKREKHNVLGNDCNFKVNSARSQTKENCAFPVIIPLWL